MPTYEYECQKCGKVIEVFHGMSEEGPKRCKECKGKMKRLVGAGAGLIFKGSGFYITDYKKKSTSGEPSGESKSSESSESKSENKSESKNESKSQNSSTSKNTKSKSSKSVSDKER